MGMMFPKLSMNANNRSSRQLTVKASLIKLISFKLIAVLHCFSTVVISMGNYLSWGSATRSLHAAPRTCGNMDHRSRSHNFDITILVYTPFPFLAGGGGQAVPHRLALVLHCLHAPRIRWKPGAEVKD